MKNTFVLPVVADGEAEVAAAAAETAARSARILQTGAIAGEKLSRRRECPGPALTFSALLPGHSCSGLFV